MHRRYASRLVAFLTLPVVIIGPMLAANRHEPLEAHVGALTVSGALAKPEFQLGEPVRLTVTLRADPSKGAVLPKASGWQMVRVVGAHADLSQIPFTPAGEWLSTMSAPNAMGRRNLFAGRSQSFDLDLSEILRLDLPGDKSVAIALRFTDVDAPDMPKSITLPVFHFSLLSTRTATLPSREKSDFLASYEQFRASAASRPRQLSPLEAELVRENERVMREHLATEAVRLRTNPPSNQPEPAVDATAGKPGPGKTPEPAVASKPEDFPPQGARPSTRFAPLAGLAVTLAVTLVVILRRARSHSQAADV